ncbi:MAG: sigma-54 dependent transcriptional regulator [Sulfurimonas sp.]|uniref:sigma-54-dependent transcriptional regulator n=1 Tax=Sulfurimonas sp. TaxID=2022749 RepID=UPI00260F3E21|nr:sigma-54 dependent transcriptional regulator [Sulfurimonas sp.]MDD5400272.1 sigma-54 dependent transcriptional regulator [Sulfurimonas sp.]
MKIAIVEDDINMRKSLEIAMSDYKEFEVKTFKNAKDALKSIDDSFDLIITDINMPGMDGIEFVKTLNGKFEVIIMTGNATLQRAIESIHLGVKDFLLKPFDVDTLIAAIKREDKIQKVKKTITQSSDKNGLSSFLGTSKALEAALNIANKAAKTDAGILLLGESGVGKEIFAAYIHENSSRAKKPFVAINMAAIPDNLIESELFGFEKGAFTDAGEAKIGQFELANGGTLFLDEIGEMPYGVQAKLLRAIQEKEVRRLGSTKGIKIDIRVISATNANLIDKIKNGTFREDLYYRLNTIPLNIPPLRERKDEILQIAQKVLEQNCKKYGFTLKNFSNEAQKQLLSYNWPGNIRELISVVERAVILSDSDEITPQELFLEHRGLTKEKDIATMERELIQKVLNSESGDVDKASEVLGMSKSNLVKKIKIYEL